MCMFISKLIPNSVHKTIMRLIYIEMVGASILQALSLSAAHAHIIMMNLPNYFPRLSLSLFSLSYSYLGPKRHSLMLGGVCHSPKLPAADVYN